VVKWKAMMMKKIMMLGTLVLTLMLVSVVTPVLAAKEKEKGTPAMAKKPDMKMVDTVIGSYTIDGTTVYFVSHMTGIMKWIAEPTDYIEWPVDSHQLIPVNGELRVVSSSLEHNRLFWDNNRIQILSSGSSYVGTLEVVPAPSEFPGLPPYMPMPKDGLMNTHTLMKFYGELGTTKNHLIVKYIDFVPQVLMQKLLPPPQPRGRVSALLTGTIDDYGLDTDENLLYEYLVLSAEVRVRTSGFYTVSVSSLLDSSYNLINVYGANSLYLDRGTHFVDVLLDGPTIYVSGFNPSMVSLIDLYDEYFNWLGSMNEIPLSREYSLADFERPSAFLTGVIYDEGVDTDSDGTYDFLEVGVEVSVASSGMFAVSMHGLFDSTHNDIPVWNENSTYLDVGVHVINVSLYGPSIYVSGFDPASVRSIDLYDEYHNWLGYLFDVPLSRVYSYTEFDLPPASLTGTIYDGGVDTDGDGTYDHLEIGVEVEVTEAGNYLVDASQLRDTSYNYVNVRDSESSYLDIGTRIVALTLNGPTIHASGINPSFVAQINLWDEYLNTLDVAHDVPLSTEYSYAEFDVPGAYLTGIVTDQGVDTDDPPDGKSDYLEIGVQIEVSEAGTYTVEMNMLLDEWDNFIWVWSSNTTYLEAGTQFIYLQLDGPSIYMQGLNPSRISSLTLYDTDYYDLGSINDIPLSRTYLYTEFDASP
jgi:hypothetical protein